MYYLFPFILGVIFVSINGLTQLAFAQSQGFKLKPTGIAFVVGAFLSLTVGSVTPLSGQSAMIALAGKNSERSSRVASLLIAAAAMTLLGVFGVVTTVIEFAGPAVMLGMMGGVGIILAGVGYDFIADKEKGDFKVGIISLISALLIFGFFRDNPNRLVYTVAGSVIISTLFYLFVQNKRVNLITPEGQTEGGNLFSKSYWQEDDFKIIKPKFNFNSIMSALAIICLSIGVTASFGNVNASIAGVYQNMNHLTFITGFVDFISFLFGGMPLAPIISGTAAAPWPVWGAFGVMLVLGILLLFGLVNKICKYIPVQSIAGFLVVIGFFTTFLPNATNAFGTGDTVEASFALGVTVITGNPFLGMVFGILIRFVSIASFFGF